MMGMNKIYIWKGYSFIFYAVNKRVPPLRIVKFVANLMNLFITDSPLVADKMVIV